MKRLLILLLAVSCTALEPPAPVFVSLEFPFGHSKSSDPPENRIEDLNLLVFNACGSLEESLWISSREYDGRTSFRMGLTTGTALTVAACANIGRELKPATLEEYKNTRIYLAYPDEYSHGMPLSGLTEVELQSGDKSVAVRLERLMARVSVSVDRRALPSDVSLKFVSVRAGNCPKFATLAGPGKAIAEGDCFNSGFSKSWAEVDALNTDSSPGLSGEVSVYILENMQGDLLSGASSWDSNIPDSSHWLSGTAESTISTVCTFIELQAECVSPSFTTPPGQYLTWRFYPGARPGNFDLRRGTHYHFTLRPSAEACR